MLSCHLQLAVTLICEPRGGLLYQENISIFVGCSKSSFLGGPLSVLYLLIAFIYVVIVVVVVVVVVV